MVHSRGGSVSPRRPRQSLSAAATVGGALHLWVPILMPAPKHGGVAKVVNKRLKNGTVVRVYFYKDRRAQQAAVRRERGKTK